MPNYLIQPKADFDLNPDDISGAVWSVGTTDPTTISGLTNGTEYVAREFILSPASAGFTPSGGLTSSGAIALAAATVAGTAERILTASGAVTLASTTVAGTAARGLTSSGAVSVPAITTAGTATAGGAFTPADLFTGSEAGFWYDPSDLTTLWTDTAGTTAATVGDAVARMDDKSGNGHHLKQATAADRPILRQDANSKYYLEWNGGGDELVPDTTIAIPSGELTSVFAYEPIGRDVRVTPDDSGTACNVMERFSNDLYVSGDTDKYYRFNLAANSTTSAYTNNDPMVFRVTCFGTPAPTLRLNGGAWTHAAISNRSFGSNFSQVAASNTVSNNFYGQVLIQSSNITSTEAADLEEWMADKAGVTLV